DPASPDPAQSPLSFALSPAMNVSAPLRARYKLCPPGLGCPAPGAALLGRLAPATKYTLAPSSLMPATPSTSGCPPASRVRSASRLPARLYSYSPPLSLAPLVSAVSSVKNTREPSVVAPSNPAVPSPSDGVRCERLSCTVEVPSSRTYRFCLLPSVQKMREPSADTTLGCLPCPAPAA